MLTKNKKAQSILEYVILLGIISLALSSMQLYFRRGIQAAVKVAADEAGDQRKGGLDIDYLNEQKLRGDSDINTTSSASKSTVKFTGGIVNYANNETSQRYGILSEGIWKQD